ncbi:MAG: hypothetical protein IT426_20885 [Pirellulales bacterium]|nr:hypothetical protein [Pirellulales bacterium]
MRLPVYRRRKDRVVAFVEYRAKRYYLPGKVDSPESPAAYHDFISKIMQAKADDPPPSAANHN